MKKIEFKIEVDPIAMQVKGKGYYTGRSRGEASSSLEAVITDILDDDTAIDISVDAAMASLQSVIGSYAPCAAVKEMETGAYTVSIEVPDHFDERAIASLSQHATQYCCAKVLYDWFASTSPADTEAYAQIMAQTTAEVQRDMRRRVHPAYMVRR